MLPIISLAIHSDSMLHIVSLYTYSDSMIVYTIIVSLVAHSDSMLTQHLFLQVAKKCSMRKTAAPIDSLKLVLSAWSNPSKTGYTYTVLQTTVYCKLPLAAISYVYIYTNVNLYTVNKVGSLFRKHLMYTSPWIQRHMLSTYMYLHGSRDTCYRHTCTMCIHI